jgi:D-inositol-3-phosphate glycosyltransferase
VAEAGGLILNRTAQRRIAVISMHTSPTASLGQSANGGLNVYVREVCTAFSDRGIATDIFTRKQSRDDPDQEALAPLSRVIYLSAGRGLDKYSLINEVPMFAAQVRSHAAREGIEYDLLYSHYWLSGEVACLLRPKMGLGWAHIAHTLGLVKNRTLAMGDMPEPELRIRIEGEISQQADLLIASTAAEGEELVRAYGAPADRVAIVPAGVDLSTFQPMDRELARRTIGYAGGPMVLFVGRLERLKGVEIAIRAMALLNDREHRDLRMLIVGEDARQGDDSEKERLKSIASTLGVRDRIDFIGSVAHHELPYFYSAADVCVMPSYSESFGLVGLEAQACGCPVVASDVPGLRSVIRDGVSGYLIDGADSAAYAERIGRLLSDPQAAEQMGRRGSLLAQRFSWSRTADSLAELFEGVIETGQARVQASASHE